MKEFVRKIIKRIVLFGARDVLDENNKRYGELNCLLEKQGNLLGEHTNSIQYFAETLGEKSFLIDCNFNEIKKQVTEIRKIQIQLREMTGKEVQREGRVYQVVPVFKCGDAIGNYSLFIKKTLNDCGIMSDIYCYENLSDRKDVKSIETFPITTSKDVIVLHMAAENEFADVIDAYMAKKVLFYHNITPAHFFTGFDEFAEQSTKRGRTQVECLRKKVDFCITVSEYNQSELWKMGYQVPSYVVPIPFEKKEYSDVESQNIRERLSDGKKNILFVGRIAPNKKMEDLIESYQTYCDEYDKNVRLILVGNYDTEDRYYQFLKGKIRFGDDIFFTGHIGTEEWITYYKCADLFLCLSEHEGFCVPLIEAMSYQIPIVAYDSSAVGETLGMAGILLRDKNPKKVAETMHAIFNNRGLVDKITEQQQKRICIFDEKLVANTLSNIIKEIMGEQT